VRRQHVPAKLLALACLYLFFSRRKEIRRRP